MVINKQRRLVVSIIMLLVMPLICLSAIAAKPIPLNHQPVSILKSFTPTHNLLVHTNLVETSRHVDFKQTLHVRVRETYAGHPVWGADAILHVPDGTNAGHSLQALLTSPPKNSSMDGKLYQDLAKDLENTPAFVFTQAQANKALKQAIALYGKVYPANVKNPETQLIVFVDRSSKAHYAYKVNFTVEPTKPGAMPERPVYIMDASSLQVFVHWNDIKTVLSDVDALGGGYGGNLKMGKLVYDGLTNDLPKLSMVRDTGSQKCYLKNKDVTVRHYRGNTIPNFSCETVDTQHQVYWDDTFDAVNGGYSPDNDALFGGAVIKDMYQKWYGVPVLTENGKPMMLTMVVHAPIDNAYWDGRKMTFGDGVRMFYPLTSLGVASHEISHGFTEQHSGLNYYGQSGGLNEAFSDMAAQAAEVYAYNKNSWQIGPEIFKSENEALRYMDKPSKDCKGRKPGDWCSIDDATEYYQGLDVHFSSGVFNHFFYLLGTSNGWDAKKAFDVMVHANMDYWTSDVNFSEAACGVLKAAKDLGYDLTPIKAAFQTVAVKTKNC